MMVEILSFCILDVYWRRCKKNFLLFCIPYGGPLRSVHNPSRILHDEIHADNPTFSSLRTLFSRGGCSAALLFAFIRSRGFSESPVTTQRLRLFALNQSHGILCVGFLLVALDISFDFSSILPMASF